jgi:hypothetical protein
MLYTALTFQGAADNYGENILELTYKWPILISSPPCTVLNILEDLQISSGIFCNILFLYLFDNIFSGALFYQQNKCLKCNIANTGALVTLCRQ